MAPPRKAALYEAGPVRVTGKPGRYRIRWSEPGRDPERTATTWERAVAIADAEAARLSLARGGQINSGTAFGALCEAWVEGRRHRWGAGHLGNVQSLLRAHVLPTLGRRSCASLVDTDLEKFVGVLATDGYSPDMLAHMAKLLRAVGEFGVRRGVWLPKTNPAIDLRVPEPNRLVNRTLVPSADLIEKLVQQVRSSAPDADQALRREWLLRVAAGCGLRWGEAAVLLASDVDLAEKEVSVTKAMNERTRIIGAPKTPASVRAVVIPKPDLDLWDRVLTATDDGVLGATLRGKVWRNSNWHRQVFGPAVEAVAGWPPGAGYHYLRHHAICSWVDARMSPGSVSAMAGHTSVSFTQDRYMGPRSNYLEEAKRLL